MCSPDVARAVREAISRQPRLNRRRMLGAGAAAWAGASLAPVLAPLPLSAQGATPVASPVVTGLPFAAVYDLTHTVSPTFPVFPGAAQMQIDVIVTVAEGGFYKNTLTLDEHTGTHMDAPGHFIEGGATADALAVETLFAPLCVVDITDAAAADPDAVVTVEDLAAWEAEYGPLPSGAFVAMNAGWSDLVGDPEAFLNVDADGVPHFPGFSGDAVTFLTTERDVVGIGVDTVSLDPGPSADFAAHITALGAGLYGLEGIANLGTVPPVGATLIVGGPKHEGASGGPCRLFAVEMV